MAKVETGNKFNQRIRDYKETAKQLKALEKIKKVIKKDLEEMLEASGLDELESEAGKVKYIIQNRSSMNSGMLLKKLDELGIEKPVITTRTIDEKVLETMMYNNEIDHDIVSSCVKSKIIKYIRVF